MASALHKALGILLFGASVVASPADAQDIKTQRWVTLTSVHIDRGAHVVVEGTAIDLLRKDVYDLCGRGDDAREIEDKAAEFMAPQTKQAARAIYFVVRWHPRHGGGKCLDTVSLERR